MVRRAVGWRHARAPRSSQECCCASPVDRKFGGCAFGVLGVGDVSNVGGASFACGLFAFFGGGPLMPAPDSIIAQIIS